MSVDRVLPATALRGSVREPLERTQERRKASVVQALDAGFAPPSHPEFGIKYELRVERRSQTETRFGTHAKVRIRLSRTRPVNYRRLYSVFTNPIGNPARVRNVPWQNGRPWAFSLKLAVDAIRRGRLRTHIDVSAEMMPPEPAVGGT